eukprot:TRINITY_DN344_c0_g1_i1.p1 TRINITY_DN344_c0_g1~~TRINITY_DN344_c0_g1_i1.p1  ORF type:complete len:522 (+),score=188.28 TRINITY_DN344_c0_g1_i1:63-1568(+)
MSHPNYPYGGYPQQQGGYPPQQGGYPPQQAYPGYPPQNYYDPNAYAAQGYGAGGYPPQQAYPGYGGYPQAGYAAPSYGQAYGGYAVPAGGYAASYGAPRTAKKAKKDKKDKKDKKKMSKEEKNKAKLAKKQKHTVNKTQVATFVSAATAAPPPALVTKIQSHKPPPGSEWDNAGKANGLQVWRIENFQVVPVPRTEYGKFYNGDSYIVLNTYQRGNAFRWDIHFWLGEKTTQDEAGTAAYKTVELDNKLGGTPVQHREVQDFESDLFLSYFKPTIQILQGGVESGFNKVKPTEYQPRLLHLKGKKRVRVSQVTLSSDSLNSGDVFVLDGGLTIYQWNGKQASIQEKSKGGEVARGLRDERPNAKVIVQEEGREEPNFWNLLGGAGPIATAEEGGDDWDAEAESGKVKVLLRLSDATGQLTINEVARGRVTRNLFQSADVFIFDSGYEIFAWVGKGASRQESTKALSYAQDYLARAGRPAFLPVSRIFEGGENESFTAALDK